MPILKILLIEDDAYTAEFVRDGLRREGYCVDWESDGRSGLQRALDGVYDAAIVDLMLPKLDGLRLVKAVRDSGYTFPILVLSAKNGVDDRVELLRAGCDDYLVKPFAFSELVARLEAILRRGSVEPAERDLRIGDLRLLADRRKVFRGDDEIILQPLEFALLHYLMRNSPRVVTRTMIMEYVWDYNFDPKTNVVESCICRLREKIDKANLPSLIHTIRGSGYVMEVR